jgi:ATP-dependent RNA helicase DeaD
VAERRALAAGAQVVGGTPGRCATTSSAATCAPGGARVVLDEADEMLDMGFREELEAILEAAAGRSGARCCSPRRCRAPSRRSPSGTSATRSASRRGRGRAAPRHRVPRAADRAARDGAGGGERAPLLRRPRTLVFCRTRAAVARLHGNLAERGFSAVALSAS